MLLFALTIVPISVQGEGAGQLSPLERGEVLREASDARAAVCLALQRWMDVDDELRFAFYELMAQHKLAVVEAPEEAPSPGPAVLDTLDSVESRSSLAAQGLAAKLRIEMALEQPLKWLTQEFLQRACEQDSKGHLPLLRRSAGGHGGGSAEGAVVVAAAAEKAALDRALAVHQHLNSYPIKGISKVAAHEPPMAGGKGKGKGQRGSKGKHSLLTQLGYRHIAKLFDAHAPGEREREREREDPAASPAAVAAVSEDLLDAALEKLASLSLVAAKAHPKARLNKPAAAEQDVRERPWRVKKKVLSWEERKKKEAAERARSKAEAAVPAPVPEQGEDRARLPSPPRRAGPPPGPHSRRPAFPRAGATLRRAALEGHEGGADEFAAPRKFCFGGVASDVLEGLASSKHLAFLTQLELNQQQLNQQQPQR